MRAIESVAVIGAGNMGSGIAQKSSQEGFNVQMVDREQKWVNRGIGIINGFLDEAMERRIFRQADVDEINSRISGIVGNENVSPETDLVIEAVFEDFDVKQEVFSVLDKVCHEHTILATNTSSLSVDQLANATGRPDRFVGLHWFYHPAKNRLVEIIPASSTSRETILTVEQYCKAMGKVVIVCKDRPGFVVNRFFVPWLNEACLLLDEGVATAAQIDTIACEVFQIGLGPFALMNLTGPTIALHSTDYLAEQLDVPRFRGAPNLRALVENGEMWEIDEEVECEEEQSIIVRDRLLGLVLSIASQIVDEGICSIEDVDRGAKVGLRWSTGPFEIANRIGVDEAIRVAKKFSMETGLNVPEWFSSRESQFEFSYVDVIVQGKIATLRLNRPEAMNALNVTLMGQLEGAIEEINQMKEVDMIVLEGAGKAFVAGADVKFFVDKIREGRIQEIYDFTAQGHKVLSSIENSPKITVALTTGMTLGGGLELALSCDYRIGTVKTLLRFPETSIGIYPGLGGTQRAVRICGIEGARYAILGGNFIDHKTAKAFGLLTHLVDSSEIQNTLTELNAVGKPDNKFNWAPVDNTNEVVSFASSFYEDSCIESILSGEPPKGFDTGSKEVARQLKLISRTSRTALFKANDLLNTAVSTGEDLHKGLQKELDCLESTFKTSDALEGLSALIEGRQPDFGV
tara:strand:- start:96 stop:2159 length:2064 start_codon:yes stop_codon:yes gene_type:complete